MPYSELEVPGIKESDLDDIKSKMSDYPNLKKIDKSKVEINQKIKRLEYPLPSRSLEMKIKEEFQELLKDLGYKNVR